MPYDIFVSYAHVDDEPLLPATEGWVTTLIKSLQNVLARKLGRREAFQLWMDHRLKGNDPLTPQIMDRVRAAAALVLVYSPGYRASEWCNREKNEFLRVAAGLGTHLFLVERDKEERVSELADWRGYRFWEEDALSGDTRTLGDPEPTVDDRLYYAALVDLGADLANELKRQGTARRTTTEPEPPKPPAAKATIFLAEVTDDLDPLRDEVRRYLEQKQIRVVPNQTCYTRTSGAAFTQEVDRDLQDCKLFVQLLSGVAGKRPPDAEQTFVQLQCERARQAGKPILQWRDPRLDVKSVLDQSYAALLQGEKVLAIGTEELKSEIAEQVLAPPPKEGGSRPAGLVFVNAEKNDLPFAQQLSEIISKNGSGYVLPLQEGDPTAVREDLERNLLDCDKVMIVYGATTPNWVREQLRHARKVLFRREHELQALAVYHGPPPPKAPVGFELPNQLTIDGSGGLNERDLCAFLARVPQPS